MAGKKLAGSFMFCHEFALHDGAIYSWTLSCWFQAADGEARTWFFTSVVIDKNC
jgi:hypothetical protein